MSNELVKVKDQLRRAEDERNEITLQMDRISNKYEILLLQKEEGDTANKKVISNLKEKIKSLNERVNEQQKNLLDVLMEK